MSTVGHRYEVIKYVVEGKTKLIYIALFVVPHTQGAHTVLSANYTIPAFTP